MKLLIGTNNPGKLSQIQSAFSGLNIECVTPKDVGITEDIEETGTTYAANAELKARFYYEQCGLPTIADDSGLEVAALPGMLGVHSRRLDTVTQLNDEEWTEQFLALMEHKTDRNAVFLTTICFVDQSGISHYFTGKMHGTITDSIMYPYKKGLPASSLFIPTGESATISELEAHSTEFTNHRMRAIESLVEYIQKI